MAEAVRRIATAILRDESAILPVSVSADGAYGVTGVSISLPCVIGRWGVERILEIPLSEDEHARLRESVQRMHEVLQTLAPIHQV